MLTSLVTKQLDIPGEPGEWIKVRMLSGKKLDEARQVKLQQIFEMAKAMGEELRSAISNRDEAATDDDPLTAFDVDVVLRAGLVAWSYKDEQGRPVRVSPDSIGELDEVTRAWAAREIVGLTVETEAQRKNA